MPFTITLYSRYKTETINAPHIKSEIGWIWGTYISELLNDFFCSKHKESKFIWCVCISFSRDFVSQNHRILSHELMSKAMRCVHSAQFIARMNAFCLLKMAWIHIGCEHKIEEKVRKKKGKKEPEQANESNVKEIATRRWKLKNKCFGFCGYVVCVRVIRITFSYIYLLPFLFEF